jgi:hypothetical protein
MPNTLPYSVRATDGTELARFSLAMHVPPFCAMALMDYGELRVHCDVNWDGASDEGAMDFRVTVGMFGEAVFTRVDTPEIVAYHPV